MFPDALGLVACAEDMLGRLKKSAMGADIGVTSAANDLIGTQPEAAYKHTICKLGKAFRQEWVTAVTEHVAYLATPIGILVG